MGKRTKKKAYKQPVLTRYGSLVMKTAGSVGAKGDGGGSKRT